MSGSFVRPAMVIDLNTKYFPFEYGFLEGPGYYDIPPLRVIFHELTHFWQTISTNYLSNVALGEWYALLDYEAQSIVGEPPDLSKRMYAVDASSGFSANDLLEALSRFWDVHTLGPRRILEWQGLDVNYDLVKRFDQIKSPTEQIEPYTGDEFDQAMLSETYSKPYKILHEKIGSFKTVIVFPILAYFAFQARNPIRVYTASVESVEDILKTVKINSIHEAWREFFGKLAQHVFQIGAQVGSPIALPHSVLPTLFIRPRNSRDNALLIHYGRIISLLDRVSSPQKIDFLFALPGDPENRGLLIGQLLPPLVRFIDGRWAMQSLLQKKLEESISEVINHEQLADTAQDIHRRYGKFQLASILSRKRTR